MSTRHFELAVPVNPTDHALGGSHAPVTLVEYGDFECSYCGLAEPVVRQLLASFGEDLRYVWRHLPLSDVHTGAQLAAEAAEAAGVQDRFWELYDALLADEQPLTPSELGRHVEALGLDMERFWDELRRHEHASRIARDVASADASGVSGTPTFFINGRRHHGAYDVDTLTAAVEAIRRRAGLITTFAQT
jgi:protein-disulfide isomerase